MNIFRLAVFSLSSFLLIACGSYRPNAHLADVTAAVAERTGYSLSENIVAPPLPPYSGSLSPLAAARTALKYNPLLQAGLSDLNVASAREIQAGLLVNPSLEGEFVFGDDRPTLNFGLGFELGRLFTRGRRMNIAEADRQQVEAQVIESVVSAFSNARIAAISLWARQQSLAVLEQIKITRNSAVKVADVIARAGNLTAGDHAMYQRAALEGQLRLGQGKLAAIDDVEALSNVMGLVLADDVTIALDTLDRPIERNEQEFIKKAVANSLILAAERKAIEGLGARVGLANVSVWLDHIEAGAVLEREDDETEIGFNVGLSLPLFDSGKVRSGAARAALEAAEKRYKATAFSVANRARALMNVLVIAKGASQNLSQRLLLRAEGEFEFELQQLNAMQIGPLALLVARVQQLEATLTAIDMKHLYLTTSAQADALMAGVVVGGSERIGTIGTMGSGAEEKH